MLLQVVADRDRATRAEAAPVAVIAPVYFGVGEVFDPQVHNAVLLEVVLWKVGN